MMMMSMQQSVEWLARKTGVLKACPPQILHDLTWVWTRAAAVRSQWPTAWAMAWS
jgi:hypothetical protein